MLLTHAEIMGANDLVSEIVPVPEWGGDVRVRTLTGAERDAFEMAVFTMRQKAGTAINIRALLVALCVVDDEGKRLFSERDAVQLGAKSAKALDRVFSVAQRLNGLTTADVEELGKN